MLQHFYRYCSLKMLAQKKHKVAFSCNHYFKNYCIHVILKMSRGTFSVKDEGIKKTRKALVTGEIPPGVDD